MSQSSKIILKDFLLNAFEDGNYATDDIIALIVPLLEEVLSLHADNLVAPFDKADAIFVFKNQLDINDSLTHQPINNMSKIKTLFTDYQAAGFTITGQSKIETNIHQSELNTYTNLNIHTNVHEVITHPVYVIGYGCFEHQFNHHDELTDIFCLGLLLGSFALGLDLYDVDDLTTFVEYRKNPVYYNQRIHPTISALITEMTELDRKKRANNLHEIIVKLQHYRDFNPEKQVDLSEVSGWINKDVSTRSHFILNKLKNRLYDTSKRNRLLYFKSNSRFVNLTVSSVPLVLHYQSINPSSLFIWNDDISTKVKKGKEISLNQYLRFEDHQYIGAQLDRIKAEAQKDTNEYGFSQLKLVVAFINWHNLNEDIHERIQSPLLLIPVEIIKRKALKEPQYTLQVKDSCAEVNPVIANYLKELYGFTLPDFIDLEETSIVEFYQLLKQQITAVNQGIQLNYIDKPRIKLIHSVAKQTATVFNRRLQKQNRVGNSYKNLPYSYQAENYKPLGLEIFKNKIEQKPSYLEFLVNDNIQLGLQNIGGSELPETVKERKLFELQDSESNPYSWDIDVCNIVVGNFNYKKMSLVGDYNFITNNNIEHQVFETLFSDKPKALHQHTYNLTNPNDWFHVVTADPTQTKAILQAREAESFIIQGPPGTGKSQTITNLIADFIANGKNVLFVCEKRAALDVVYYRLKQQQLHELCCYIHDSQNDKKSFIKNLKETYDDFLKNTFDYNAITIKRNNAVNTINIQLGLLHNFHFTNHNLNANAGISIKELINTLVNLKPHIQKVSLSQQENFPHYNQWLQFGQVLDQLSNALEQTGADAEFANHTFSKINETVFTLNNPITTIEASIAASKKHLQKVKEVITAYDIPQTIANTIQQIKELIQDSILLEPLAIHNNVELVIPNKTATKQFEKEVKLCKAQQKQLSKIESQNSNWINKFSFQETSQALLTAQKHENSFFKFLNSSWRDLKKQMQAHYNFANHAVQPAYTQILENLMSEHILVASINEYKENFNDQYGIENIDTTYLAIEKIRTKINDQEVSFLLNHPNSNNLIISLQKIQLVFFELEKSLAAILSQYQTKTIQEVYDLLDEISLSTENIQELLPALKNFAALPTSIKETVKNFPSNPNQLQANMANKTWESVLQDHKAFGEINSISIEQIVNEIKGAYKKLLQLNAQTIRANIRKKFAANIELSMMSVTQLNNEQKVLKKQYNEGRKILENEFSKSMRFKSIRELSAKESGLILKDIKPIWLMSPLSVSDSLPIDINYFDVVIFDEASQITLEEGIPALYRAKQSIIVGDEMQMPPTNFFSSKAQDPDDLVSFDNEAEDEILSADADSLLTQGARKLNSVLLGWHYRSRYETLISYSNHAFYNKNLLTIPDKTIHHHSKTDIIINDAKEANEQVHSLLNRSISYHYLPNSIYQKRSNLQEAAYIAQLVKALLLQKTGNSIGIVAFSQEQQMQIEDALTALANNDKEFEALLETEYNRIEDDQFVGLIIKNLENIQGDERDIIIMSVCYGFDERRKMLMNFGPINKKGGEKRLNVIFSRAKKYMAIISSIKHNHITNEYNEGANYFKRFLHYAEMVSTGNMQTANAILGGLVTTNTSANTSLTTTNYTLEQLKLALQQKGYETDYHIGQSSFKCSLAIKQDKADKEYCLGIIIDDDLHYENPNWLEQYFQRPTILQDFGWQIISVFTKDWLQQPHKVVERIISRIQNPIEKTNLEDIEELSPLTKIEKPVGSFFIQEDVTPLQQELASLRYTRLEFKENNSNKFWQVAVNDAKMIVQYGKVGNKGQTQIKTFATGDLAFKEAQKLIVEKEVKGYLRV